MPAQRNDEEWIALISAFLINPKVPENPVDDPDLLHNKDFQKLLRYVSELRELSAALSKGDLQKFVFSKGFVLSNMKALQSHLRHLAWQTKQVAEGDFSQRVEFLGDFSESFNEMTTRLQDSTLELQRLANMDFLTQIPNRRSAMMYLDQLFSLFKRTQRTFSVLIFDIDFFKHVNDTYGHDAGDLVLKATSQVLRGSFRESDMFCRLGGEEFIAILPETDLEGATIISERARTALANSPIEISEGKNVFRTVSIGASQAMLEDQNYNSIIIRSDSALYAAKESGRNKTCTEPPMDVEAYFQKWSMRADSGKMTRESAAER
ncbi:MAG: GGDEF domain-containing protein [Clostridiales Family XIII bacterium]|jgi:diguanylate cyclase (GGDEF)-like protein|nr:GGDEF domain-containing protein [Clostridiales Family XIII bacterium]